MMIRSGDRLQSHWDGAIIVVGVPRTWSREGSVTLRLLQTDEEQEITLLALFAGLQSGYYHSHVPRSSPLGEVWLGKDVQDG